MKPMLDFSSVTSLKMAEHASKDALLLKTLLIPEGLGGRDLPENVVFIPPGAKEAKDRATLDLIGAVRMGVTEITVVPEYRDASFVPSRIFITAARPGAPPEYELEIGIW